MTVESFPANSVSATPDESLPASDERGAIPNGSESFAGALGRAFGDASAMLEDSARAERAFESGRGGLQEMVLQRAQADVALSLASAAASRAAQALTTILGMAV